MNRAHRADHNERLLLHLWTTAITIHLQSDVQHSSPMCSTVVEICTVRGANRGGVSLRFVSGLLDEILTTVDISSSFLSFHA